MDLVSILGTDYWCIAMCLSNSFSAVSLVVIDTTNTQSSAWKILGILVLEPDKETGISGPYKLQNLFIPRKRSDPYLRGRDANGHFSSQELP